MLLHDNKQTKLQSHYPIQFQYDLGFQSHPKIICLAVLTWFNHLEKCEYVNGKDDIP